MTVPHFNIVFATPANALTPQYVRSLLISTRVVEQEGLTWNWLNRGGSLVAMAREETIGGWDTNNRQMQQPCSGEFTYDKIMWIDSDISWEPPDLFRLFNSDKDIISGCYLMEDRHIPIYQQPRGGMMPEQLLNTYPKPFTVAGCGFGFIAVKSGVFETMPRPWFGPESVLDDNGVDTFYLIGEDLSWCTKAIKSGYEIWVDPRVRVKHQKTQIIDWLNR